MFPEARFVYLQVVQHRQKVVEGLIGYLVKRGAIIRLPGGWLIAREAVDTFQAAATEAGVTLRLDDPPASVPLEGDGARLMQVLFNFLTNALKFTPAGGQIDVSVRVEGDEAVCSVHDTGGGIQPADLVRLFHPFTQVHEPSEARAPGTGLGLYISRGIAEEHGGSVSAESPGRGLGATFHLRLPMAGRPTATTGFAARS